MLLVVHTIDDDSHFPYVFPLTMYFCYLTLIGYDNQFDSSNHYTSCLKNIAKSCRCMFVWHALTCVLEREILNTHAKYRNIYSYEHRELCAKHPRVSVPDMNTSGLKSTGAS